MYALTFLSRFELLNSAEWIQSVKHREIQKDSLVKISYYDDGYFYLWKWLKDNVSKNNRKLSSNVRIILLLYKFISDL